MTRPETKHTVGALETHQGHQSRAGFGFCFFLSLPFSKHRKCATMTKCSGMFQFALNCITLQQEIRVSSAVPKKGPAYPPTVYTRYTSVSFGGGQVEK